MLTIAPFKGLTYNFTEKEKTFLDSLRPLMT